MAAKKNETTKVENDMASATAALAVYKNGVTLKNAPHMAEEIANVPTEGGIQRSLAALAFAVGKAAKKANMANYKFDDVYNAYSAKFYVADRKMPNDDSLKGYRSRYNAFCEAGQATYDATAIVRSVMAMRDVSLAWRAGKVRELLKANKTKAPEQDVIDTAIAPDETNRGGLGDRTPAQKLKGFVTAGITLANDEEVKAHIRDSAERTSIFRPVFEACLQAREIEVKELKGKRKTGVQTEIANLKLLLESLTAKPAKAGRRHLNS